MTGNYILPTVADHCHHSSIIALPPTPPPVSQIHTGTGHKYNNISKKEES
jgi:hypothetical protein